MHSIPGTVEHKHDVGSKNIVCVPQMQESLYYLLSRDIKISVKYLEKGN